VATEREKEKKAKMVKATRVRLWKSTKNKSSCERRYRMSSIRREWAEIGKTHSSKWKQIEKQLLNKGSTTRRCKALNLKYELLKLEKAIQQQGEEKKAPVRNQQERVQQPKYGLAVKSAGLSEQH
jgi:hypothetical protein